MKFEVNHKDKIYDCEWFGDSELNKLKNVSGAHGFIFNEKGEICVVKVKDEQGWCLPGGRTEAHEKDPLETFIREVNEEANLIVENILPLGYFSVNPRENPQDKKIDIKFIALVKEINKLTQDPAEGIIPERKFIKPEEFNKHVNWGENGEFQLKKALKKFEEITDTK